MTVYEVAAMLSVNPETVRRWIRSGQLRASMSGDMFNISHDNLNSFFEKNAKYKSRVQPKTDEAVRYKIEAFEAKIDFLTVAASSLEKQQKFIQNEIESLKESINVLKGESHESEN